jgi:DNA-directed RNA polymerase specialized sigma24 family protein
VSAQVDRWDGTDVDDADVDPAYGRAQVVQDGPAGALARLRVDFGAHLEANYQRLVAQLYAITLDAGEAHDAVQEAYSRAWRQWAVISRQPDPTSWVRSVAVRSTMRSWRRTFARFGFGRQARPLEGVDPRTAALLGALSRLGAPERRAAVLFHMAGVGVEGIALVEQVDTGTVEDRLAAAQHVMVEGLADELPAVLGEAGATTHEGE